MALTKEDHKEIAAIFAAAIRDANASAGEREAAKRRAEHDAKRERITELTHKTKSHARYRLTAPAYISGQGLVPAGQIVTVPLKHVPSHTWQPVNKDGDVLDLETGEPVGVAGDELEDIGPEPADGTEDELKPVKAAKPAKAAAPKPADKSGRANDKDVA